MDSILAIKSLFFDSSNRPKKTPVHESVIQRRMEERFTARQVRYALNKLERKNILSSKTIEFNKNRLRFYFPCKIVDRISSEDLMKKIKNQLCWIQKYSDPNITSMLGEHLHSLVKAELRIQGFQIKAEKSNEYKNKMWSHSSHKLDIIAQHKIKGITIGVEIKNTLDTISKQEILTKIKMCNYFEIIPVFACRWLKPHVELIISHNGLPWQFDVQMYPLGQERLVNNIQKKFKLPIGVRTELPPKSVQNFYNWLDSVSI